jgi:uncharacterized membrane protein
MTQPNTQPSVNNNNTIWIYLSYILGWIFGLIGLIVVKGDEHVRFHCAQAFVYSVILYIAYFILGFIPILGWIIIPLLGIAAFIYAIMVMLKAAKGEHNKMPFCGDFAEKNVMGWFK